MSNRLNELRNLPPDQLLARAGEVLPPWVVLLLVLAIAWQLVQITWHLFPQSSAEFVSPVDAGAPAPTRASQPKSYDVGRIAAANLFGARPSAEELVVIEEDFGDLDDTDLKLTLHGTIPADGDSLALAIIADDRGDQTVYSVGDPISGGRKLHSVKSDQVILNHNGELEALRLPREYEETAARSPRTQSRRPSPARRASAGSQLQSIAANPTKLTDLIRPQPVFSNGKQLGYRVYPGRRRQQFVSLGLKPGDLVTEINGSPLNDPARGAEIFKSLAESNQVTVTVERNGSPQVLVLDTDKLNEIQAGQEQ